MSVIAQVPLKDGNMLEVFRFIMEDGQNGVPEWVLPFAKYGLSAFWSDYYNDLWNGKHPGCRDYLYVGRVNGTPCGRIWFGYSLKNGSGNFGNVVTLPEYRRRGIMKILLDFCVKDFYESGALFCSCDAAESAAPSYAAAGFRYIFSQTMPPMAIVAKHIPDFTSILVKAYGNTNDAVVRNGVFCDRFDCDKLLWYDPDVYGKIERHPEYPDYLRLWSWSQKNHIPLHVLETATGFCAGFSVPDFVFLHPAFEKYKDILLKCR